MDLVDLDPQPIAGVDLCGISRRLGKIKIRMRATEPGVSALSEGGLSYFVNIGLEDVGGVAAAGERLNVNQTFQPEGRFAASNSP